MQKTQGWGTHFSLREKKNEAWIKGGPPAFNDGSGQNKLNVSYTYYKDGSLNTLTYPSGDVVTYTVGGAGRPTLLSDSANNYVGGGGTTATYAPQGALAGMVNGYTGSFAGIVTADNYNDRLQPIWISASVGSSPFFSLCYDFHLKVAITQNLPNPCQFNASAIGDNGNVYQVLDNYDPTRSAAYIYDPLNRIAQAYTVNETSANCWGETFAPTATAPGVLPSPSNLGIDAWGNLTNRSGVSGMGTCVTEGLSATASTKNQLSILTYDAAGGVTNDGNGNQPTYDAEDRIATDAGVTYYYDADGFRMQKSSGTLYWPGPSGEILTETDLSGNINEEYIFFNGKRIARVDRPSGTVHYYFSDHLGSASVITDLQGNVSEREYFFPYGGIVAAIGSDPNHYKFTGKESDIESGLDFFGRRHYTSAIARWMTPDRVNVTDERVLSPTNTLNKYVYSGNNPLKYLDPDGEDITVFYDQGGVAGHIVLLAYDQSNGNTGVQSFGPANHGVGTRIAEGLGIPVAGEDNYNLANVSSPDKLRGQYTAITFQTSPEEAEAAIQYIKTHPDGKWSTFGSNCTTTCVRLLRKLGRYNFPSPTPRELFWGLFRLYGKDENESMNSGFPRNGTDYGNRRDGYDAFEALFRWTQSPNEEVTHKICWTDDKGKPVCQ